MLITIQLLLDFAVQGLQVHGRKAELEGSFLKVKLSYLSLKGLKSFCPTIY